MFNISINLCVLTFLLFSNSHVNHFTGIVYQSVLLSQKQSVRHFSVDELVQPNTSPAQWPGIFNCQMCLDFCYKR